jgi:glycerol-3-phosphate acyltransferase PlsX
VRIAVDAMGGDRGPREVVRGVVDIARGSDQVILLVGNPSVLEPEIALAGPRPANLEVVPAADVIGMDEQPTVAFRRKPDASVVVAARLVKDGRADALVTIGNTGAAVTVAVLTFRPIKGIDRPAIAVPIPTVSGKSAILLDAGATVDCDPNNLYDFAVMGSVYAEHVFDVRRPRVGILSNGEEASKGNDLVKRTHALFKSACDGEAAFSFVGNVEGRDVFRDVADVVVCDGFVGNVFLKTGEGVAEMVLKLLKDELGRSRWTAPFALPLKPRLKALQKRLDYSAWGGEPLLGVNGLCIIGHGRSDAGAVANACRVAARAARHNIIEVIRQRVCNVPTPTAL